MNTKLILKNVTLAFAEIVEPKEFKGKKRWGANFIIEADSTAAVFDKREFKPALGFIQTVLKDMAAAEFAGKLPTGKDSAFRDGNEMIDSKTSEVRPEFAGKWFIAAYRQEKKKNGLPNTPPLITNARLQPVRPGEIGFPQGGDRVCVILDLYTMGGKSDPNKEFGRKVNSGFDTIQYLGAGDSSFGASAPSTAGLEPVEEDPTAEL